MRQGKIGLFLQTKPLRFLLVVGDQAAELPVDAENAIALAGALIHNAIQENSAAADAMAQGDERALPAMSARVN